MKPMGALPLEFAQQNGLLKIGGRTADNWAARTADTPLFVYDMAIVVARIARFRAAMPAIDLHYAIKANPHADLLTAIAPLVDGLDVASSGELAKAMIVKPAASISFAGPGKRDDELSAAITAGATLNVESEGEAARAFAIGDRLGQTPRMAVRVNPDIELRGSGHADGRSRLAVRGRRGAGGSARKGDRRSGRGLARVPYLRRQPSARCRSDHRDAGRDDRTRGAIGRGGRRRPPLVNLGGGFGVPYFASDAALDIERVGEALAEALASRPAILAETRFAIELGRWLVAEAGVYLTRVIDIKQSQGETFVVVDGGLNHQLAASGNFGTVVRRNYPIAVAARMGHAPAETVSVVGPLCTPLDRLGDKVALPPVHVGDLIAIFMAGAYGASASPTAFLGHPPASEIVSGI
ncbi:pyridoxal-dependent decarboxylase, exosortase A system-associated [Sphingomonas sp. H160509]|uniref:pyridoxal-dependent decarboxylase, exosortase A system-associated n=1 Tax=Sphingomonas sp. H160509 TaxID=2955313 RepID=UPI002096CCB7|nr:pyridoxal-dependent decarboxylase, exosortase A system-associated [Sphingomonas sp. H160509]MDD1450728.1 pyridoxal-dependent decarboxylase, exosortase A system-associated [Sphingomonas sp. H160509]